MSKKVLNTQAVVNELKGQSAFFRKDKQKPSAVKKRPHAKIKKVVPVPILAQVQSPIDLPTNKKNATVYNAGNRAYTRAGMHASTPASALANKQDDLIETIRKTVKQVGKDTLFVRLTPDEKHQVVSTVYAFNEKYRGESRKTSENEIGRIGVNFLLGDYKANGKNSILARVLAALHA